MIGKVRMLLEWTDGLLSKVLECMDEMGEWIDSVMTTRAPAVLKILQFSLPSDEIIYLKCYKIIL